VRGRIIISVRVGGGRVKGMGSRRQREFAGNGKKCWKKELV
jgi:hypothetical protein